MGGRYLLKELAEKTGSLLLGDPDWEIDGVGSLETATSTQASFLSNSRYLPSLASSEAGVICIDKKTPPPEGRNCLVSDNPSKAFQAIVKLLLSQKKTTGFTGIHPTAVVHPSAQIGENVSIGPYAVIDEGVTIGDGTLIMAHVFVGLNVRLGKNCLLYPHSIVRENCLLGDRVILQPGAVIGSCGFGYIPDEKGHHQKLEQLGNVVIGDDVEIGANTTIDRARFETTHIRSGTKIDNLVQIGHNVDIGEDNIIVSQTGVAGSAKTGHHVIMGGQAGVVGHLEIAPHVMIATRGGVSKSIKEAGRYGGEPVMPLKDHNKMQVHLRKIDEYATRLKALEEKLSKLDT